MQLIQKIAIQARKTFSELKTSASFQYQLNYLKELAHKLTSHDLCLDERLVRDNEKYAERCGRAPVTYVHINENRLFTLGIFVLRNGVSLPLHDHPGMHGVIKLIHGCVNITSYSAIDEPGDVSASVRALLPSRQRNRNLIRVKRNRTLRLDTDSPPCVLDPTNGNYHEISTETGSAAFVDILSPPYDQSFAAKRTCRYYEEVELKQRESGDHLCFLMEIPQPQEFYCDSSVYSGPDVASYVSI